MAHWSDCATNNGPALPVGPCDCGGDAPTEMIERVAIVIEMSVEENWPAHRTARAVIEAMRTPTASMWSAGATASIVDDVPCIPIWNAMIEAALAL